MTDNIAIDTIIVGAGASGCMSAIFSARYGKKVLMFEPNEKIGRKLRITGKGRCNVTNNSPVEEHMKNIPFYVQFIFSVFSGRYNEFL